MEEWTRYGTTTACNLRQYRLVACGKLAHFRGNCPQSNEHNRESDDERNRVQHYFAEQRDVLLFQFLNPDAGCRFALFSRLTLLILMELCFALIYRLLPKSVDFCLNG